MDGTSAPTATLICPTCRTHLTALTRPVLLYLSAACVSVQLQSGKYTPAPAWVSPPVGQYLHPEALEVFWTMVSNPEATDMTMINQLFFFW